jgi:peroxiredoxin
MKSSRLAAVCSVAIAFAFAFAPACLEPSALADDEAQTTLVKVGQSAPDFTCKTITGEEFSLSQQKGKVVLINFFATWCGPCQTELPHLQKGIQQQYADRKDFRLIVIGREHNAEELEKFAKEKNLSLPMAPDPKREIYGKYAAKYIPRNIVVGKDGKIKLASAGYTESGFQEIVQTLENELKQPAPAQQASAPNGGRHGSGTVAVAAGARR